VEPPRHPRGPEECRRAAKELGYQGANALYVLSRIEDERFGTAQELFKKIGREYTTLRNARP
jgi:hypothetical protein